jgi:hypothetical protein
MPDESVAGRCGEVPTADEAGPSVLDLVRRLLAGAHESGWEPDRSGDALNFLFTLPPLCNAGRQQAHGESQCQ